MLTIGALSATYIIGLLYVAVLGVLYSNRYSPLLKLWEGQPHLITCGIGTNHEDDALILLFLSVVLVIPIALRLFQFPAAMSLIEMLALMMTQAIFLLGLIGTNFDCPLLFSSAFSLGDGFLIAAYMLLGAANISAWLLFAFRRFVK